MNHPICLFFCYGAQKQFEINALNTHHITFPKQNRLNIIFLLSPIQAQQQALFYA